MSVKQQLAAAIEALPESATLEEAIQRIYRALKLKQALEASRSDSADPGRRMVAALEALATRSALRDISDPVAWEREVRRDRPLPGRDP